MNKVKYYISDLNEGNLALHIGNNEEKVLQNRKNLASKLGFSLENFIYLNQIHESEVFVVLESDKGKGVYKIDEKLSYDAIITNKKGVVLSILVADCVPIIVYDEENEVVGVVHAGWKGTYKKILKNTIEKMLGIGAQLENIKVIIGPSIDSCSYEVGKEVGINFRQEVKTNIINNKQFLDLKKENILQALETGVKECNIENINIDTFRDKNYFSARRDGFNKGRFGAFIWID